MPMNSFRGHSSPDSCHCFLDSISHVSLTPHVIFSCATLLCVLCSDWFLGCLCLVLIDGFCHVVSWSSIKDALTHSKIAESFPCFLVYLCFDLWAVFFFIDWLLPTLIIACLWITLLPLSWIVQFAGVRTCLFWPRLLKGSYDAISSFPFSLECYKLFVIRSLKLERLKSQTQRDILHKT